MYTYLHTIYLYNWKKNLSSLPSSVPHLLTEANCGGCGDIWLMIKGNKHKKTNDNCKYFLQVILYLGVVM